MRAGGVSYVILGAVRSRPRSGYEIKQLVDRATRYFWAASYGQLYPELHRLEETGLITGTSEPRGGRQRVVYSLTPAGREALEAWLRAPEASFEVRDERLLKLFFSDALEPEAALDLLRTLRTDHEAILDRLRETQSKIPRGATDSPALVLEYGIASNECVVEWCRRAEKRLAGRLAGNAERRFVER